MMSKDYSPGLAYADFAFCLLTCFICLFSLMFLMISKKNKNDAKVTSKAEFMITVEWPADCRENSAVHCRAEGPSSA